MPRMHAQHATADSGDLAGVLQLNLCALDMACAGGARMRTHLHIGSCLARRSLAALCCSGT